MENQFISPVPSLVVVDEMKVRQSFEVEVQSLEEKLVPEYYLTFNGMAEEC